MANELKMVK